MEEKYCLTFGEALAFRRNFFAKILADTKGGKLVWQRDHANKFSTVLKNIDDLGIDVCLIIMHIEDLQTGTPPECYRLMVGRPIKNDYRAAWVLDELVDQAGRDGNMYGERIAYEIWGIVSKQ